MNAKALFSLLFVALAVSACQLPDPNKPRDNQTQVKNILGSVVNTPQELLFNDILADDFVSTNVTVLGLSVGMSDEDLTAELGKADQLVESDFGGVKDYLFGASLGLNETGIVFHSERGIITRITVTRAAESLLQGASVPGRTKEEVYAIHGIPERQYDFAFVNGNRPAGTSLPTGRYFAYNKLGFEVYFAQGREYQYAFVYPMRKLPSMAFQSQVLTPEQILANPKLPTLMTDTTTLCSQGKTYGYNPASPECEEFVNACEIPDWWIEIAKCSDRPPYVPKNTTNTTGTA